MTDSRGEIFTQALDRYEVLQKIFASIQDGILLVDEEEKGIVWTSVVKQSIPGNSLPLLMPQKIGSPMFFDIVSDKICRKGDMSWQKNIPSRSRMPL